MPKAPTRATGQAPNDTPQQRTQTDGDDDIQIVSERPVPSVTSREHSNPARSTSIKTEKPAQEDDKKLVMKRAADVSSTRETSSNGDPGPSAMIERERKKRRLQLQIKQNKPQQQLLDLE